MSHPIGYINFCFKAVVPLLLIILYFDAYTSICFIVGPNFLIFDKFDILTLLIVCLPVYECLILLRSCIALM